MKGMCYISSHFSTSSTDPRNQFLWYYRAIWHVTTPRARPSDDDSPRDTQRGTFSKLNFSLKVLYFVQLYFFQFFSGFHDAGSQEHTPDAPWAQKWLDHDMYEGLWPPWTNQRSLTVPQGRRPCGYGNPFNRTFFQLRNPMRNQDEI